MKSGAGAPRVSGGSGLPALRAFARMRISLPGERRGLVGSIEPNRSITAPSPFVGTCTTHDRRDARSAMS